MEIILKLFGEGKDLSILQMTDRSVLVFIIAFLLIRISGRRSFGQQSPLDNIIAILLGAILSRAVVGASPFVPIIVSSLVIVLFHRFLSWLIVNNPGFSKKLQGEKILLYDNGEFIKNNMDRALVCQEDIMQGIRKSALTDSMENIARVYLERNGEISAIRKE